MILWHEKFLLPEDTISNLKKKYCDEYFLKGDPDWGQHYTGYHRNPNNSAATGNGGFVDKDLLSIYVPKLKSILKMKDLRLLWLRKSYMMLVIL